MDIADKQGQRGVEHKIGYQSAKVDNLWEIERDSALVARGWLKLVWDSKDVGRVKAA